MQTAELEHYYSFCVERDLVWQRREAGYSYPWTGDSFIRDYWFTNVHRDRDRGTRWIMSRLTQTPSFVTVDDLIFALICYRQLNRLETFERFGLPESSNHAAYERWFKPLEAFHATGGTIGSPRHFTSIKRVSMFADEWMTAGERVSNEVWFAADGVSACTSLTKVKGIGPFTALQVVADLLTSSWPGARMTRDSMVPLAVGSRLALHLIMTGEYLLDENTHEGTIGRGFRGTEGLTTQQASMLHLIRDRQPVLSKPMTFVDIEHSLCEWTKYRRLCTGVSPSAKSATKYRLKERS